MRPGLEELLEPEVVQRAEARFDFNDEFDFSVVGENVDFVVAWSIWTHASKSQIGAMLDSFARTSSPAGVLLTSYRQVHRRARATTLRESHAWRNMGPASPGRTDYFLTIFQSFGFGAPRQSGGRSARDRNRL